MRERLVRAALTLGVVALMPVVCLSQRTPQSVTLTVNGQTGEAQTVRIRGRSYVDVETLARLTNGSISFQGNKILLTIPGPTSGTASAAAEATPPEKTGFSKDFMRASIEEMAVIREWRSAIVNAVQNNQPVTDDWIAGYRRAADAKLNLVSVAVTSDSDRRALPLVQSEFRYMQQLSDKYLAQHKAVSYTSPDSFDNDPLDQQVLGCSRALGPMLAGGQFEDVVACH